MSIGESLPYVVFWICACVSLIAWLIYKAPKHQHRWKEVKREKLLRSSNNDVVGEGHFASATTAASTACSR